MGLFDHFRKKTIDSQQEKVQTPSPAPQVISSEPRTALNQPETLNPTGVSSHQSADSRPAVIQETNPIKAPSSADNVSAPSRQSTSNREIRWPRNGTDARWLANNHFFFVYVDAHFIRSKGAPLFVQSWREEKEKKNTNRNWFIAQFELDSLTDAEKQVMSQWSGTYGIRNRQKDYCEIFSAVTGKPIVFLTQDGNHIPNIRNAASKAGNSIQFYTVFDNGRINSIEKLSPAFSAPKQANTVNPVPFTGKNATAVNAFDEPMKLAPIRRAQLLPYRLPGSNMTVHTGNGDIIRLGRPVMSNTISITYETNNPDLYAKIYTADILKSTLPEKKCKLMLSRTPSIQGVCWPISALSADNGAFVGILVPKAEGIQLHEILLRESTVRKNLPDWNKKDMTELALTILNMIRGLQTWHVYFGCLNLASIFVKTKTSVCFTDIDEWQIDGYPVLSENKLFVPPELQRVDTRLHFYNQDEINYQIAFLVFMLMMPGRLPYAQSNESTLVESITKQEFAFGMGDDMRSIVRQNQRDAASGFWRFVWDHLSYNLGVDLYQTFAHGGIASTAGKRYSINKWLRDMNDYSRSLEKPDDIESLKIYPRTFRRTPNRTFVRCSFCGVEHPAFYIQETFRGKPEDSRVWINIPIKEILGSRKICKTCYYKSSEKFFPNDSQAFFKCDGCNKILYYTNAAKFTHQYQETRGGWKKQRWCPNCKEPYQNRICCDCGQPFDVTVGEYRFSQNHPEYRLPLRCITCRGNRRAHF